MSFRLFIILTFILIGRPQDYFYFLMPFRPALVFTFITLFATLFDKGLSLERILETSEGKKYTLLYCIMIFGIPFAYHRRLAFNGIFLAYLSNMLYFYLFIVHVDSIKKLKTTLFTLSVCALGYSMFALSNLRYSRLSAGSMFDPNDIAYFFITILPISFIFVLKDERFLKKIIATVSIIISLAVTLMTGSRGGFVGLLAMLLLILLTNMGGLKRSYKITLITALMLIFFFYGYKIDMERYRTITNIESDYNITDEFGRIAIWKRGLGLTLSNPITGVGFRCFPMALGYERDAEGAIPRWQTAHNSYLLIISELGLIGFTVFMSIIFSCLKNFAYWRKTEISSTKSHEVKTIGGFLQIAFIGSLVTAFFLSKAYSILFTLFFAISGAMRRLYPDLQDMAEQDADEK